MSVATDEFGPSFHTSDQADDDVTTRTWSCRSCAPIGARGAVWGGRIVVVLHGVEVHTTDVATGFALLPGTALGDTVQQSGQDRRRSASPVIRWRGRHHHESTMGHVTRTNSE
jgi:hypothetical protein